MEDIGPQSLKKKKNEEENAVYVSCTVSEMKKNYTKVLWTIEAILAVLCSPYLDTPFL